MKKRLLLSAQVLLFGLFNFSLIATIFQFSGNSNPLTRFDSNKPVYNHIEAYDPSLLRINSLEKLEEYCDSIYAEKVFNNKTTEFERTYVEIVSNAVRNRFYHGYSDYGFSQNYMSFLLSKATIEGLNAPVIPDDILQYPYAACSQQSIVMMEVLKVKGIATRKIAFLGKTYGGHFAFEVFYDGSWHFHDPNLEPNKEILNKYGRPGIEYLVANNEILFQAYNRLSKSQILDIFPTYSYGPVNKFPAPRAIAFQRITKFLSYTAWFFFLVSFLLVRRKYLKIVGKVNVKNRVISIPQIQPEPGMYYPDFAAQRS